MRKMAEGGESGMGTSGSEIEEALAGLANVSNTEPGKTGFTPFQFKPPNYNQFALDTGFGYGSWADQMKDAFSMPSRGGGVFMGNKAPRYGTPAPNLTFPTAFQGLLSQFAGGQGGGQPGGPITTGGLQGLLSMLPGAMPPRGR